METALTRNIHLYRWSRFLRNMIFWQAVWFLYFQNILSGAEAILLYVVYEIATTAFEVPSGYMSDRLGRKKTLLASAVTGFIAAALLFLGDTFAVFVVANIFLGASMAFSSGTDESMLYESLAALDREDEIEAQEIIAWRYSFVALALSAVAGGAMTLIDVRLPYGAMVAIFAALFWITTRFVEPPRKIRAGPGAERLRMASLGASFRNPVLLWFFAISVLMYGFSHLPFIFGQPFILEALDAMGLATSAPLVSGAVTSTMMVVSVLVSLVALRVRDMLGLPMLLLCAFALQIAISGVMSLTDSAIVLVFLMFRMVPEALSRPFILGRIQPLLPDDNRATWLSLKSFAGRLLFASALAAGAISTTDVGTMPYADIARILTIGCVVGIIAFAVLAITATRIAVAPPGDADR